MVQQHTWSPFNLAGMRPPHLGQIFKPGQVLAYYEDPEEILFWVRAILFPKDKFSRKSPRIIVDLPDAVVADNDNWRRRRELAAGWARALDASRARRWGSFSAFDPGRL